MREAHISLSASVHSAVKGSLSVYHLYVIITRKEMHQQMIVICQDVQQCTKKDSQLVSMDINKAGFKMHQKMFAMEKNAFSRFVRAQQYTYSNTKCTRDLFYKKTPQDPFKCRAQERNSFCTSPSKLQHCWLTQMLLSSVAFMQFATRFNKLKHFHTE